MLTSLSHPCSSVLPEGVILRTHQPQQHWQQNIIFDCSPIAMLPFWGGEWTLPGFRTSGRVPRNGHCTHRSSSVHVIFCSNLLLICMHYGIYTHKRSRVLWVHRPNWILIGIHTCALILVYQSRMCPFTRSSNGNICSLFLSNQVAGTGFYTLCTKL